MAFRQAGTEDGLCTAVDCSSAQPHSQQTLYWRFVVFIHLVVLLEFLAYP